MSYQKCPLCNGQGITAENINNLSSNSNFNKVCTACHGAKIISELTGLPPFSQEDEYNLLNSQLDLKHKGSYALTNIPSKVFHKTISISL